MTQTSSKGDSSSQTGFWEEENKPRSVVVVACAIFASQRCNYLAGESRVVGHNDTWDVAILLQPQQWPDHNETATLYLGAVLHNRAFPGVASHEQEKPKSTKVQDFLQRLLLATPTSFGSWPICCSPVDG